MLQVTAVVFLVIIATIISIMGRYSVRRNAHSQRGDTIVEVLISVVVIATILSGAFVVALASSHNVQSSQEHSYALQQIQAQIEAIRSLTAPGGDDSQLKTYPVNHTFCTYLDAAHTIQFTNARSAVCAGNNPLYKVTVTKGATQSVPDGHLTFFKVAVSWDKLGGGTNYESLNYGIEL